MHETGMQVPERLVSLEKGYLKGKLQHLMDSFFSMLQRGKGLTTRIICLLRQSSLAVWTC